MPFLPGVLASAVAPVLTIGVPSTAVDTIGSGSNNWALSAASGLTWGATDYVFVLLRGVGDLAQTSAGFSWGAPSGWTQVGNTLMPQADGVGADIFSVWYKMNPSSTDTWATGLNYDATGLVIGSAWVVSNANATTPVEATVNHSGTIASLATTQNFTSGTLTTGSALFMIYFDDIRSNTTTNIVIPSGMTGVTPNNTYYRVAYLLNPGVGPFTETWTLQAQGSSQPYKGYSFGVKL
jgi:hypothetical protein